MFLRIDKLAVELPQPTAPDPNAAAAVQELMGGRFGEMSTLMNYMFQSFNFRGREQAKPYYELVANIAAEEAGHIEAVAATINLLLNGPKETKNGIDPIDTNLDAFAAMGLKHHGIVAGQGALCANSLGEGWNGSHFVFSSGNLVLDLLHNFHLEGGARMQKMRVYEMSAQPTSRALLGYLFIRGGVHQVAYGKALEKLTGVNMNGMLPTPNIKTEAFPESKPYIEKGLHRILYRFSPDDYKNLGEIWNGAHPEDGGDCSVADGPPEGFPLADLDPKIESFAPDYDPGELMDQAKFLTKKAGMAPPTEISREI